MTGPQFVDNREGNTFSKTIREHLHELRNAGESPEELSIATGYFNAAGWLKVSKEVHQLNKVRLLIGAERLWKNHSVASHRRISAFDLWEYLDQ